MTPGEFRSGQLLHDQKRCGKETSKQFSVSNEQYFGIKRVQKTDINRPYSVTLNIQLHVSAQLCTTVDFTILIKIIQLLFTYYIRRLLFFRNVFCD